MYISIVGMIYLFMLFVPNIIWTKNKPSGYDASFENKILVMLEKVGEVLVSFFTIISFQPFQMNVVVIISFVFMAMYECYWIEYFKSMKTMKDFYKSFCGIALAGVSLPIIAIVILGVSQCHIFLIISTIILAIGHVGIHRQHYLEIMK